MKASVRFVLWVALSRVNQAEMGEERVWKPATRFSPEYFQPNPSCTPSHLGRILLPPRWGEGLALLGAFRDCPALGRESGVRGPPGTQRGTLSAGSGYSCYPDLGPESSLAAAISA